MKVEDEWEWGVLLPSMLCLQSMIHPQDLRGEFFSCPSRRHFSRAAETENGVNRWVRPQLRGRFSEGLSVPSRQSSAPRKGVRIQILLSLSLLQPACIVIIVIYIHSYEYIHSVRSHFYPHTLVWICTPSMIVHGHIYRTHRRKYFHLMCTQATVYITYKLRQSSSVTKYKYP